MPKESPDPRSDPAAICCVIHDLQIGGTARLYLDLLSRIKETGCDVTLVAGPGPLAEPARYLGLQVATIDWAASPAETYAVVEAAAQGHDAGEILCDPALVHVLPALLGACGRAALALHSDIPGVRAWFGEAAMRRLVLWARALVRSPAGGVLTRGRRHRRDAAALLSVEEEELAVVPPGVAADQIDFDPAPGEPGRVVALTRLSPEVAARVDAAIELVAAGLQAGRPCRLELVGDGPWKNQALRLCAARLPRGAWQHRPATLDPLAAVRGADLVVATGLTGLEAAAAGRPVAIARRTDDGAGVVGPLLTPETYRLYTDDIYGFDVPATAPTAVWSQRDALTSDDLRTLRRLVETENSSATQRDALLGTLRGLKPLGAARGLVAELGRVVADLENDLAATQAVADRLWVAQQRRSAS
jgi:glycosyltransferase involved in cell wall biosynthesis